MTHAQAQAISTLTDEQHGSSILKIRNLKAFLPRKKTLWEFPNGDLRATGIQLLLGRNGAGKSTLLRTLLGMNKRYSGTIAWDPELKTSDQIAYLPELAILPVGVKVEEWVCWFHGIQPSRLKDYAPNYLKSGPFAIDDLLQRRLATLSKGQLQKVQIWQSLYHNPKAVLFDEPFSGLDPWHKKELIKLMLDLSQAASLLISTHEIPAEFEQANTRIWLIDQQKQIRSTTLSEFRP